VGEWVCNLSSIKCWSLLVLKPNTSWSSQDVLEKQATETALVEFIIHSNQLHTSWYYLSSVGPQGNTIWKWNCRDNTS